MTAFLTYPIIETYKRLFQAGSYDFVTVNPAVGKNHKQEQALRSLMNSHTTQLMYGGAAGGAKSWTGCTWLMFMSLLYPETKWFIGRESLKDIRDSTLITFGKVARRYGVKVNKDYKYNGQDNFIQFANGSRIDMLDLRFMPSDPLYERLGSKEYTGGFLEECGQIHFNAFDTLKSRINRHMNDRYGIPAKLFLTCNPKKNWIYTYFVRPDREGTLEPHQQFIKSLFTDNVFREKDYEQQLRSITDKVQRARLMDGNFDYDDDPTQLIDYDNILNIWSNRHVAEGDKYISCDVARFGRDSTVLSVWSGFRVIDWHTSPKTDTVEVAELVLKYMDKYHVPGSNVIIDEDGVGGGVVDILKKSQVQVKGFINNSVPLPNPEAPQRDPKTGAAIPDNYRNLKSQCYFRLADKINQGLIYVAYTLPESQKEQLIQELEQVKQKNMDKDKKREILGKDEVKGIIGRSPDSSDNLMMRMYFDLKPKRQLAHSKSR